MTINRIPFRNRAKEAVSAPISNRHDHILGIDPDVSKSGLCWLNRVEREIALASGTFVELIDTVVNTRNRAQALDQSLTVIVEAGWLNKSNWHAKSGQNHRVAAKIGAYTGANHQIGKTIIETLRHHGIEVVERKPLRKCWKGPEGKITDAELRSIVTNAGYTLAPVRTNQEMRDAALLAWDWAGETMAMELK